MADSRFAAAAAPGTPQTALQVPFQGNLGQGQVVCGACGENTTFLLSRPRGVNPLLRWELKCLALNKLLLRRLKDPTETEFQKKWAGWDAKQREQWFRQNKHTVVCGTKKQFDDYIVTTDDKKYSASERSGSDKGITFSMFEYSMLCAGKDDIWIAEKWKHYLTCGEHEVETIDNVTHIWFYNGLKRKRIEGESTSRNVQRRTECDGRQ